MKFLVFIALCILGVAASPIEGPQTAIVGGTDVAVGTNVPYHVHLLLVRGQVTQVGSGVYIGPLWVLTVAQNIKIDLTELRCGFGNRDRNLLTWVNAINFFRHPDYNAITLNNNIGLIQLVSNPTAAPLIVPIALAQLIANSASGTQGIIYGFGFTTNVGAFATILQQTTKTIQTDADCLANFPHLTGLLGGNFCAIGAGPVGNVPSMCSGDQGGPFVAGGVLVGISSFMRNNNCLNGLSSGFVRVSAYNTWVLSITGPLTV